MPTNLHWMEWLTVLNANQSTLDGVVDSFKWEAIENEWSGYQFQLPTNLHRTEWLTVSNANQCTSDGVVDRSKCQPINIRWSG